MTTTATNKDSLRANRLTAVVDFAVSSHARAVAVLVVAALLAFLPGFFQIPPTDRDEARFAQATKQMLETGEYVDIRFQDEVRYKKPVGIYWLQAAVVKTADALGVAERAPHDLALSHSLADRRDRRGAADLLDGARLRLAPRRAAGRIDDGDLDPARRRSPPRQDRRHAAAHRRRRDGRDGAHLSRRAPAGARPRRLDAAGDLLDRARRRHPDQGAADRHVRRPHRHGPGGVRPLGALACGAAADSRRDLALRSGAAVVPRHRQPLRLEFLCPIGRPRSDEQGGQRPGGPWRAAGLLFRAVLGDVLAGRDACRHGRPQHLGGAPREGREIPAVLDRAGLDRAGTGDHQASALRAAALSGDRDPDRGRGRSTSAGAPALAHARRRLVLLPAGDPRHRHRSFCW